MKSDIEQRLGFVIPDCLYSNGIVIAEKKLQSIILRYGDANGVRRTPDYLEELVTEAIRSELLTIYTLNLIG